MDFGKKTVKINIYGMEYPVKAGEDVEYVKSVAKYVDGVISEIDKSMTKKSPLTIAVMAALNIADELFREREEKNKIQNKANQDASRLIEKIGEKVQNLKK